MVEFALTIGLFLMLMLGLVDFGLLIYSLVTIQHAASEGARYGVTGQQFRRGDTLLAREASIRKVIEEKALVPRTRDQQLIIKMTQKDEGGRDVPFTSGGLNTLNISVDYPYKFLFAKMLGLNVTLNLKARSVMRNEQFPNTGPLSP